MTTETLRLGDRLGRQSPASALANRLSAIAAFAVFVRVWRTRYADTTEVGDN